LRLPLVLERGAVKTPVWDKPFQPSARDVAGADVIAMDHGTIRCFTTKNSADAHVSLYDEFDICNRSQLAAVLGSIEYRRITIDLAHTTFIDASIVGVLARLASRCRKYNAAPVRIVNASPRLRRLFSISQLEGVFRFEDQRA